MRVATCLTAAAAAMLLAGCSRPTAAPSGPDVSAPPPPERTDAQRIAALAALPAPYNQADLENGASRFALCRSCHTINQGGSASTGPNLFGHVGRPAASLPGFNYSAELRAAGIVWDGPNLDRWLTNPRAMIPGTKMIFVGMPDATNRRDLIAYLMVEGSPPPATAGTAAPTAEGTVPAAGQ